MIRIINNTDQSVWRLMELYKKEIHSVPSVQVESIVFDQSKMTIWGIDKILLETE